MSHDASTGGMSLHGGDRENPGAHWPAKLT